MSDRSRLRLLVLQLLVLSLFLTLASRLWFLQVMNSAQYVAQAQRQSYEQIVTPAPRGRILDAQGKELAKNVTKFVVTASAREVPRDKAKRADMVKRLSGLLQMPEADIADAVVTCDRKNPKPENRGVKGKCWNGSPFQPIPIKRDVSQRVAFLIEEHAEDFPGIDAMLVPVREYPRHELAAHLLGYIQPINDDVTKPYYQQHDYEAGDLIGKAGLELQYDLQLRGERGRDTVEINRAGAVTRVVDSTDPKPGSDLILSLDMSVQASVEDILKRAILKARETVDDCVDCSDEIKGKHFTAPSGAAVVLEAKTGRVVAMASYPTFDPMKFLQGIAIDSPEYKELFDEKTRPLFSRAVQGEFAPGSTFKHVSTAARLTSGGSLGDLQECPGTFLVGSDAKSNFEGLGEEGLLTWKDVLVKSCDTSYYKLAYEDWKIDEARIAANLQPNEFVQKMALRFGFGRKTGIDLPSEGNGAVPTRKFIADLNTRLHPYNCKQAKANPPESKAGKLFTDLCQNGSKYRGGDHANLAVGQGYVLTTPLQLAVSYAALVNGGNVMEPHIARAIVAPGGAKKSEIKPKVTSKLGLPQEILDYMKNALADVPKTGTARCAFGMADATVACDERFEAFPFSELAVGGKTGTAEVSNKHTTSWFSSFGPVADPRYVVVVALEEAGPGGTAAAPALREIWDTIYGLEGREAALRDGALPEKLPTILRDGRVFDPYTKVTIRPASTPTPTPTPATAPTPIGMPAADLPGRRGGGLE